MKKLFSIMLLCVSTLFLSACDTLSLFHTASVTANYSGLQDDYEAAKAAVERACVSMSEVDCNELKVQVAIIDNIKTAVSGLNDKDEDTLKKLITVENIKAYYIQGKSAWVNIESILRTKAEISAEDEILLESYNIKGRQLSSSLDALLEAAESEHPEFKPMLTNILQIIGLTARTAALF